MSGGLLCRLLVVPCHGRVGSSPRAVLIKIDDKKHAEKRRERDIHHSEVRALVEDRRGGEEKKETMKEW